MYAQRDGKYKYKNIIDVQVCQFNFHGFVLALEFGLAD